MNNECLFYFPLAFLFQKCSNYIKIKESSSRAISDISCRELAPLSRSPQNRAIFIATTYKGP